MNFHLIKFNLAHRHFQWIYNSGVYDMVWRTLRMNGMRIIYVIYTLFLQIYLCICNIHIHTFIFGGWLMWMTWQQFVNDIQIYFNVIVWQTKKKKGWITPENFRGQFVHGFFLFVVAAAAVLGRIQYIFYAFGGCVCDMYTIRVCGCRRIYLATFCKLNNKSCAQIIETHLQSV